MTQLLLAQNEKHSHQMCDTHTSSQSIYTCIRGPHRDRATSVERRKRGAFMRQHTQSISHTLTGGQNMCSVCSVRLANQPTTENTIHINKSCWPIHS